MKSKTYKFYSDPGHGWLAVKRQELKDLRIDQTISSYSYQKGLTIYLEEDCDMGKFIRAYKEKYGHPPQYTDIHKDSRSPIRSYQPYWK